MTATAAAHTAKAALQDIDHQLLQELRQHRHKLRRHDRKALLPPAHTTGERMADWVAQHIGSWRFILIQSALFALWMLVNAIGWALTWDPYPFILLNLMLSFQAAYAGPIIMMSQNRAAEHDRTRAQEDYDVNVKAELEIELLHHKIDLLREQEIVKLIATIDRLAAKLDAAGGKT